MDDRDLRVLGAVAATLSPDDLSASVDRALDVLRRELGADDAELFLAEPDGGHLLLASCLGRDRDVLQSRLRFPPGIGYPGIVAATRRVLVEHNASADDRFLRAAAKYRGVRTVVAVPLLGAPHPIGSLHLVWRADAQVEHLVPVLGRAAAAIGTTVRAGLATWRQRIGALSGEAGSPEELLLVLAEFIRRAAGARRVMLLIPTPAGRDARVVAGGKPEDRDGCQAHLGHCPLLQHGHGAVLGGRAGAGDIDGCDCPAAPRMMKSIRCCLPLFSGGRLRAAALLDLGRSARDLPTRDLVPLLAMAQEAALHVRPDQPATVSPTLPTPEPPLRALGRVDAAGTAPIRIRCFGSFEVRLGGNIVSPEAFGRRKALSLLKILALHCGRPVHREALVEWLWPDASGDAGLNSLHVTVHALRAALEPDAPAPRRSRHVRCSGEQFSLELPPDAVDLVVYRSLLSTAHAASAQRRTSDAATALERAAALYCGDLFDDTPYEDWCAAERQELRRRQLDALFELGSLHLHAGRAESAVETFRRALRIEPAHEDFARALIEALLASGRRAEAALEYRERVRLLREQLDVEPSPALRCFAHLLGPT